MDDELYPFFEMGPRVPELYDENSHDSTEDLPMTPPPEEIVEVMQIVPDPPGPRVPELYDENSHDSTDDLPTTPPPEEIAEEMQMVPDPPALPEPEATIPLRRKSARIENREKALKQLQDIASERNVNTEQPKSRRGRKPKRALSGKHIITCDRCGNSLICFPVRTKYFTCAEVDGQLIKVKQISAKMALNYGRKKNPKRGSQEKNSSRRA
ncbi:uncharacterized protein LOC108030365 isoform X2 [Drosophila biarmipes]|uniref:uncharacterized protein LOC108030365 isoform X2 n=1 Tax=Drosophila biarmipes TaxID=125945 RepID=UPI0007E7E0F0|nr:uncharacterized protein LOC108030365 isoform X2 [Drosophila biarmipes]